MAKQVLLAFTLLSIVIAVSYIKGVRGDSERQAAVSASKQAAIQLEQYEDNVDSLRSLIGQMDYSYAESLSQRDLEYGLMIDSLFDALDSVECELDSHLLASADADPALAETEPMAVAQPAEIDGKTAEALRARTTKILDYYTKKHRDLPADLTEYERKVSLYEIRLETARKYEITLTELKRIRNEGGLTY